ncbi:MAG: hypothetical protein KME32_14140 [Mojavia pulchra JT2-VF2]|uniref:Uncharacterized protein n=1 Tax=Mojavia pulchra JT2-VF2 TaxID=287848 RepID=A0A951UG83_9NOST|nr:hypothetical protein [Mojavia pulchra JT2-VF2]
MTSPTLRERLRRTGSAVATLRECFQRTSRGTRKGGLPNRFALTHPTLSKL